MDTSARECRFQSGNQPVGCLDTSAFCTVRLGISDEVRIGEIQTEIREARFNRAQSRLGREAVVPR